MATRIGCDHLVFAVMTVEETAVAPATYAAPVSAPGVMSININPNASQETLFADDGPMETATTLGKIEVEIQKNELTTAQRALLLGHKIDADGALVYGDSDVPPFVAVGFRTLKSDGSYRYVWLYKGKFTDPEDNNETKGDGINFQADTITGQFVKQNYARTVDGTSVRPWKYELDQNAPNANAAKLAAWFDAVQYPSAQATNLAAVLDIAYAQGTAQGTTKATINTVVGGGNHWGYMLLNYTPARPVVGERIPGATTYVSAADIAGATAGDVLAIYQLSATNTVVGFAAHTVLANEIKP